MKKLILLCVVNVLSIQAMDMQSTIHVTATEDLFKLIREKDDSSYEILESAIKKGADVNAIDNCAGRVPLAQTALLGKCLMFNYLVKNGAYVKPELLGWAITGGHFAMIEMLLKKYKIDVNAITNNYTPLHLAIRRGDKPLTRILLNEGAKINPSDYGWGSEFDSILREEGKEIHI